MTSRSEFFEVPTEQKAVIELAWRRGIEGRHLLKFYYESKPIVVATQTPPMCRFIYDDEDPAKMKAQWLKIKYV